MNLEAEIQAFRMSMDFEIDMWADAELAKIRAAASAAREAFAEPKREVGPLQALMMAQAEPFYRQLSLDSLYAHQQMGNPYAASGFDWFGLGGVFVPCVCCGR